MLAVFQQLHGAREYQGHLVDGALVFQEGIRICAKVDPEQGIEAQAVLAEVIDAVVPEGDQRLGMGIQFRSFQGEVPPAGMADLLQDKGHARALVFIGNPGSFQGVLLQVEAEAFLRASIGRSRIGVPGDEVIGLLLCVHPEPKVGPRDAQFPDPHRGIAPLEEFAQAHHQVSFRGQQQGVAFKRGRRGEPHPAQGDTGIGEIADQAEIGFLEIEMAVDGLVHMCAKDGADFGLQVKRDCQEQQKQERQHPAGDFEPFSFFHSTT